MENTFHRELKKEIDDYVALVYGVTKKFPKDEIYGLTSQFRRASLSVALNYIEGFARQRKTVDKLFLEIAYGSFKESKYLVDFSRSQGYLDEENHSVLAKAADRIGAMLYGILKKI